MDRPWNTLAETVRSHVTPGSRERVRVTDLLVARAAAERRGLVPSVLTEGSADASVLASALDALALRPVEWACAPSGDAVQTMREAAALAAEHVDSSDVTAWTSVSQGSDPGRKSRGAYSTPRALAEQVARLGLEHCHLGGPTPSVCDPSAGHGALLLAAFRELLNKGFDPDTAARSLYGVELDDQARELCCLVLWLAIGLPTLPLKELQRRVIGGNSLVSYWERRMARPIDWVHSEIFDLARGLVDATDADAQRAVEESICWDRAFPQVFEAGGFDVILSNPPWESLRQQATGYEAVQRQITAAWLRRAHDHHAPDRLPALYQAQGRGDANLYKAFVELYPHLLRRGGRLAALIPGAFASDLGTADARRLYLDHMAIEQWTSYENLNGYFPIDGRYKFGILTASRSGRQTEDIRVRFLAREAHAASEPEGHLKLTRHELEQVSGPHTMFPEILDATELQVLTQAFAKGTPFFDSSGSFGQITYRRELDLTLDRKAGRFLHVEEAAARGLMPCPDGTWISPGEMWTPLVEGRMVGPFDFFQKSWVAGSARSARWESNAGRPLEGCQPQFVAPAEEAGHSLVRLAICDVTSATNTRTMLATWVPPGWSCGNTAPVLEVEDLQDGLALLAVLNSMTFDWILRRIVGGLHLNRFYLESTPLPSLDEDEKRFLASYAMRQVASNARYWQLPRKAQQLVATADARQPSETEEAAVETIVARSLGLTARGVARVFSPDETDRRGLWRHFRATPDSWSVAERAMAIAEEDAASQAAS